MNGEVNLILADGCTLNAEKGIGVYNDNAITIWGSVSQTGTLKATGGGPVSAAIARMKAG